MENKAAELLKETVENVQENHNLAMDLLAELKSVVSWQRKAIKWILISAIALIVLIVGGFLYYLSLYDYVSYQQDGEGYNNINMDVGGDVNNNNGAASESPKAEGN